METGNTNIPAMIGIFGAILTVLIKLLDAIVSWKKDRKDDIRVKNEIEHTIKEVEFIDSWLGAVSTSSTDKELESRRNVALEHLDRLMLTYQKSSNKKDVEASSSEPEKRDKGFYVISVFLAMVVLGMFLDDDDNWSITYFQDNLDSDALTGFGVIFVIWVYFLKNSSFVEKLRGRH